MVRVRGILELIIFFVKKIMPFINGEGKKQITGVKRFVFFVCQKFWSLQL